MRTCLIVILAGLMAPLSLALPSPARHLERGKDDFNAGQYSLALSHFFEVLKESPENIEAKSYISQIGEIWRHIDQKTTFDPGQRRLGLEQAQQLLRRRKGHLAQLSSELEVVRRQLETGTADSKGLLQASRSLTRFKETNVTDRILAQQSRRYILLLQEQLRIAVQRGESFQNPRDILIARGFLRYYKDDLDNALKEWQKASAMAPGDKLLEEQILWVSKKKAILDRDQTMQEILNRATASFERGEYEQSLLDWRSLVILQPDNTDFQKKLVACQDKLRQSKTAKAMRLAQVSLQKGALTEASQHYLEVLEIDPGNKESLEQLKKIQDQLRSRMEDKNTLSRTVTASKPANLAASPVTHSSPKLSDDQYTLGLIYYSQGDMPKARIAFESALNYDPANQKAKNALARLKAEVEP